MGKRMALIKAVGPMIFRALKSGQLLRPQARLTQPIDDVQAEYDVPVTLSDGSKVLLNVFKSKKALEANRALPVIMCAHPYDNHALPALGKTPLKGPPFQYRVMPQMGRGPEFSTQTSWESPDPNFWVANDYVVVNMNLPGYGGSEGEPTALRDNQAKAYYEAIEWVAEQPWCNGNIGLNGVSYLAMSQYAVAACRAYGSKAPAALKCISPWEGMTDVYRDLINAGGVPQDGFLSYWFPLEVKPALTTGKPEDFFANEPWVSSEWIRKNPLYTDLWAEKAAPLEAIDIPILTCVSFSDVGVHGGGAYRGFMDVKSEQKWMYTHRQLKWDNYYSEAVKQHTLGFMDYFLKDKKDNGWEKVPTVRLEVRSSRDVIHEVRGESEWPIARTKYERYYLGDGGQLVTSRSTQTDEDVYRGKGGERTYTVVFDRDTEITGHAKLRLWVETRSETPTDKCPDDMAVFAALNKLDAEGKRVPFYGTIGNHEDVVSRACIRVALRSLDPDRSTPEIPWQKFDELKFLRDGEIADVEIAFPPTSVFFAEGECLQLVVASHEPFQWRPMLKGTDINHGIHVIHRGGQYDSYLQLPTIPTEQDKQ